MELTALNAPELESILQGSVWQPLLTVTAWRSSFYTGRMQKYGHREGLSTGALSTGSCCASDVRAPVQGEVGTVSWYFFLHVVSVVESHNGKGIGTGVYVRSKDKNSTLNLLIIWFFFLLQLISFPHLRQLLKHCACVGDSIPLCLYYPADILIWDFCCILKHTHTSRMSFFLCTGHAWDFNDMRSENGFALHYSQYFCSDPISQEGRVPLGAFGYCKENGEYFRIWVLKTPKNGSGAC